MMAGKLNPVASLADLPLTRRDRHPGVGSDETNVSRALGLTQLGASYFEVKPGESAFPLHAHYLEDEIIYVIAGEGTYRFGSEAYPVQAGDFLSAPAGRADVAHQLTNSGAATLKYLCISNLPETNVVELPELGVLRIHSRKPGGPPRVELPMPSDKEEA